MNVLIGCECSGISRDAFIKAGHNAISCDYEPSERPGPHLQCDVMKAVRIGWDMIILHPDCKRMACSGNGTWAGTVEREEQVQWTYKLWLLARRHSHRVALENPQWSVLWAALGGRTQTIHPWEYGHRETKATGFKLHNIEPLVPTDIVGPPPPTGSEERKEWERVWRMPPSAQRSADRARWLPGFADAQANQWGNL